MSSLQAFNIGLYVFNEEGQRAGEWIQPNVLAPDRERAAWIAEHLVRARLRTIHGRYPVDVLAGYVDPAPLPPGMTFPRVLLRYDRP